MRAPIVLLLLVACLLAACGRGGGDAARDDGPGRADAPVLAAGDVPDTSRAGRAFLAVWKSGALDELRVVRATDGAIVVAGVTDLPAGTRVTVTLLGRPAGGDAALEPRATTRATVDLGHVTSAPLTPVSGPAPFGLQVVRVTVPFGPGEQDEAVRRAADDGRRWSGPGRRERPGGGIVFETTLEVPL